MSRRGYRTMFRSESFPSCRGCRLCIVPAPGFWLQTGPCMPYGLWLRVATRYIIIISMYVCMYVCLSVCLSFSQSVSPSVCLSVSVLRISLWGLRHSGDFQVVKIFSDRHCVAIAWAALAFSAATCGYSRL